MSNPAVEEAKKKRAIVRNQWLHFSQTLAFQDLMSYIDDQREMYRKYAEERAMPHPNPAIQDVLPLDNETVAALLQNSRGLNIVKSYISGQTAADVVQSNK